RQMVAGPRLRIQSRIRRQSAPTTGPVDLLGLLRQARHLLDDHMRGLQPRGAGLVLRNRRRPRRLTDRLHAHHVERLRQVEQRTHRRRHTSPPTELHRTYIRDYLSTPSRASVRTQLSPGERTPTRPARAHTRPRRRPTRRPRSRQPGRTRAGPDGSAPRAPRPPPRSHRPPCPPGPRRGRADRAPSRRPRTCPRSPVRAPRDRREPKAGSTTTAPPP